MHHEERRDQRDDRNGIARDFEQALVGFDSQRNITPRRCDQQRPEHDEKRKRERSHCRHQRVADRFQPQPVPASRLGHAISAVQRDAQAFDAVRCEIDCKRNADGECLTAGAGQDVVNFSGQCIGHLLRPGLQHQLDGLIGQLLAAEETGKRCHHDQERKQRHQGGQRDMACDRPAVVGEEGIEGVQPNVENVADLLHRSPGPRQSLCKIYGSLVADANANVPGADSVVLWRPRAAGVM